jgi:hypothetical protein
MIMYCVGLAQLLMGLEKSRSSMHQVDWLNHDLVS